MRAFLRYFGIASGIQVGLCLVTGLMVGLFSPKLDFLLTVMLYIYAPSIYLLSSLGHFTGTSAMVYPILIGIPLGVLLYASVFGVAMKHFRA